jgi:hypothetical protein
MMGAFRMCRADSNRRRKDSEGFEGIHWIELAQNMVSIHPMAQQPKSGLGLL